jgi:checkpoint serine/threonine-protein kinase
MTFHTKEAMNEVYDIFNQPLKSEENPIEEENEDDSDDDYTSAGESTGTGRFSEATSEYGDETDGDYTAKTNLDATTGGITNVSGFSEFTAVQPGEDGDFTSDVNELPAAEDDITTPTSPERVDPIEKADEEQRSPNRHVLLPHRQKGHRLPFMTPIVEKTESSLGALTSVAEKEYQALKTPSRRNNVKGLGIADDLSSSPFEEMLGGDQLVAREMAPPAPPKLEKSKPPPAGPKANTLQSKSISKEKPEKGPIIQDKQCNPIDEGIRKAILDQIQPPLCTYNGFFDFRGTTNGRSAEIRKFAKAYSKSCRGSDKTTTSIVMPPTIRLPGAARTHTVRRELGRGAFAPVYLVDSESISHDDDDDDENKPVRMGEGDFGVRRGSQEALKMEEPPSAWEFYMIRQARRRLGVSRPSESIVDAYEMHLFDDEAFLIEEYRNQGTLLDLVNICRADGNGGGAMDEFLAMFFTVELFRTVEALHAKGLIHGDLKADNILVRFNTSASESMWTSQYCRNGSGGWADKGITIIDFGRGVDMKVFKPDVQFIADWKTTEADCAEMREMRPWTFQVDYHGLAGTVHSLLFGKYLEIVAERSAVLGAGATKTYRIRESFKRYWQTEIWVDVFNLLLNPLQHLDAEEGKKLPVLNGMKALRERIETYLEANCEKGVGLKATVRRMEGAIRERKK